MAAVTVISRQVIGIWCVSELVTVMTEVAVTVAAFPSTYFYAHFGLSHKKNTGWKCQDAHKF